MKYCKHYNRKNIFWQKSWRCPFNWIKWCHSHDFGQIIIFYFYCLQSFSNTFLMINRNLSTSCRVIGMIESLQLFVMLTRPVTWVQYGVKSSFSIYFFFLFANCFEHEWTVSSIYHIQFRSKMDFILHSKCNQKH